MMQAGSFVLDVISCIANYSVLDLLTKLLFYYGYGSIDTADFNRSLNSSTFIFQPADRRSNIKNFSSNISYGELYLLVEN